MAAMGLAACTVEIDGQREGFPCNYDGSCRNGLLCRGGVCVRPEGSDGCEGSCREPSGPISLRALPPVLPADGSSRAVVESAVVRDGGGAPVGPGVRFRVWARGGTVVVGEREGDALEIEAVDGRLAFEVRAGTQPGEMVVGAESLEGSARGTLLLTLLPTQIPREIVLTATPPLLPADGTSTVSIQSGPIEAPEGGAVPDGTLATVELSAGSLVTPDADPMQPGGQVAVESGQLAFEVRAASSAGPVTVTVTLPDLDLSGSVGFDLGPATAAIEAAPVPADGVTPAEATLRLLDGEGAAVPGFTPALELSLGSASPVVDLGDGRYAFTATSIERGSASVRVLFSTYALDAEGALTFLNAPPVLSVEGPVSGLLPLDVAELTATVADVNPGDTVQVDWQVRTGPPGGVFLETGLAEAAGERVSFLARGGGTWAIDVHATDGLDTVTETVEVGAQPFTLLVPRSGEVLASALDPLTGEILVVTRTGTAWMKPAPPADIDCDGGQPLFADAVADGSGAIFAGLHFILGRGPPLMRVQPPMGASCPPETLDVGGSRFVNSLALRGNGDLWIATEQGLKVLPAGATTVDPAVYQFQDGGSGWLAALAFDVFGHLLVGNGIEGLWRTPIPFDPASSRIDLDPGSEDRIRAIVPGAVDATGRQEAFVLTAGTFGLIRIPDLEAPDANLERYDQDAFGRSLGSLQDGVFEVGTQSLWAAGTKGLVRLSPALG
ncbi:MAG: hypothetical protein D6729_19355, partial [Deltaproteobacteria bacterium]